MFPPVSPEICDRWEFAGLEIKTNSSLILIFNILLVCFFFLAPIVKSCSKYISIPFQIDEYNWVVVFCLIDNIKISLPLLLQRYFYLIHFNAKCAELKFLFCVISQSCVFDRLFSRSIQRSKYSSLIYNTFRREEEKKQLTLNGN